MKTLYSLFSNHCFTLTVLLLFSISSHAALPAQTDVYKPIALAKLSANSAAQITLSSGEVYNSTLHKNTPVTIASASVQMDAPIKTGKQGRARLVIDSRTFVNIGPSSDISLVKTLPRTILKIRQGHLVIYMMPLLQGSQSELLIQTPQGDITVKNGKFEILADKQTTQLAVFDNRASWNSTTSEPQIISEGQNLVVNQEKTMVQAIESGRENQATSQTNPENYVLANALKLLQQGEIDQAKSTLLSLQQSFPYNTAVAYYLGGIFLMDNDLIKTQQQWQHFIDISPDQDKTTQVESHLKKIATEDEAKVKAIVAQFQSTLNSQPSDFSDSSTLLSNTSAKTADPKKSPAPLANRLEQDNGIEIADFINNQNNETLAREVLSRQDNDLAHTLPIFPEPIIPIFLSAPNSGLYTTFLDHNILFPGLENTEFQGSKRFFTESTIMFSDSEAIVIAQQGSTANNGEIRLNRGSDTQSITGFRDSEFSTGNDNISIPLNRVIESQSAIKGYYSTGSLGTNQVGTLEYSLLNNRLWFAEGDASTQPIIDSFIADNQQILYTGSSSGEYQWGNQTGNCTACGSFSATVDFGQGTVNDFKLDIQIDDAFSSITANQVTLGSNGGFLFDQSNAQFLLGINGQSNLAESGAISGQVFAQQGEILGGVFSNQTTVDNNLLRFIGNYAGDGVRLNFLINPPPDPIEIRIIAPITPPQICPGSNCNGYFTTYIDVLNPQSSQFIAQVAPYTADRTLLNPGNLLFFPTFSDVSLNTNESNIVILSQATDNGQQLQIELGVNTFGLTNQAEIQSLASNTAANSSDSINISLDRTITLQTDYLQLGFLANIEGSPLWESNDENTLYYLYNRRLWYAVGQTTTANEIDTLIQNNAVFDYQGTANADFVYDDGRRSQCSNCGEISARLNYGSQTLENFQLSAQTENAALAIQANNVSLHSNGDFQFNTNQAQFQLGNASDSLAPAISGSVAGGAFGPNAEAIGGRFNANGLVEGVNLRAAGNFGGTR